MKRNRKEAGWDAVRPFVIYNILFISIRFVLTEILKNAASSVSYDMSSGDPVWYTIAETAVIGIASAGAALPLFREGQRHIMTLRRGSGNAWIAKRKDGRFLIGILPLGTVCLSALLNLLLAGTGSAGAVPVPSAALPVEAAVYGILTPFIEEMVYRGIVWYRLRTGFPMLQAAFLSSILFGAAHADLRQGIYAFVMGMVFSLSFDLTRRFEVPFLLHCTCNLAVLAASSAGWGEFLRSPMWIVFFAVTALAVFGYWGFRFRQTNRRI